MARILRQSTSVDVPIGPFLDETDGKTAETGLSITQPDIRLKKNGGAWAQKNAAQTLTHEENGNYEVTLDATDTNTLGLLRLHVIESGALPVWEDFLIWPANIYDSFFSTDLLQVDLTQWLGSTPNALVSSRVDASAGALGNGVLTEAAINPTAVTKLRSIVSGTADSGSTTTTMVDAARTESAVDYWKGCFILFGTALAGQCRLITGFNPTTDTITFAPATTAAVTSQDYEILPAARVDLHSWLGSVANSLISGRVDANAQIIADGAIAAATFAANAIGDAAVNTDMDSYSAKIGLLDDNGGTADRYEVAWFKNNNWITSGITSPTIQVVKSSDGSNLFAAAAMTEIGSLHLFKKTESTDRIVSGASYWAIARATIDGSERSWPQIVGRDST